MHAAEREKAITDLLRNSGFISFRDLERQVDASPATLRRDLERLASGGMLERVRGGARLVDQSAASLTGPLHVLRGVPFHENIDRNRPQKKAIGKAAAALCAQGEGVMIDGGSTTLQMCEHLGNLNLQVLTNSLHIVSALIPQTGTRVLVPGGAVFREQNIILSPSGEDCMPRFYAPKLFMGGAAVGAQGVMQADPILVASERRFVEMAEQVILLVDSSKFTGSSGHVVCGLDEIDVVVTDKGIPEAQKRILEANNIRVILV